MLTHQRATARRPPGAPGLRRQELPLRAEPTALRTARGFADAAAAELGLDEAARFRFTLAANEAVANAIEHGAPREDGTVLLRISCDAETLCFEVHDCGSFGVDWSKSDPLSERGRGLPLMAALVDEVDLKPGPTARSCGSRSPSRRSAARKTTRSAPVGARATHCVVSARYGYLKVMALPRQGTRKARLGETHAELTLSVPASLEACTTLRRAVRALDNWFGPAAAEDVELLVTELATNSVKHAAAECGCDRITLDARVGTDRLRIAVRDCGNGFDAQQRGEEREQPGGWGLMLVEDIADRWGIEREPTTTVWFELARAA